MSDSVDIEDSGKNEVLEGVPGLLKERLLELMNRLDNVEELVNNINSITIRDEIKKLSPLEQAKLDWISIYAINSLFFVYLKNNGVNLKEHPIMSELLRVKNYMSRINEISLSEEYKNKKDKVDKESTARIIKRSLWMNATNKSKSKVAEIVSNTLESGVSIKRDQEQSANQSVNKKIKFESDEE